MKMGEKYFGSPIHFFVAAICTLLLVSCGDSAPDSKDIRTGFASSLPSYVEIRSFEIQASETFGGKVEPRFRSRVRTTLVLSENLYAPDGKIGTRPLVRVVASKGASGEIFFVSESALYEGKWHHKFRPQSKPFYLTGSPRSAFGENGVVRDSDEHKQIVRALTEERERVKALVRRSKVIGQVTVENRYRGVGPKYGNGMRCGSRLHCLDQQAGTTENHIAAKSLGRQQFSYFWYGNLTRVKEVSVWKHVGIYKLEFRAYNTLPSWELSFNSLREMRLFKEKVLAAHSVWRSRYCPDSKAMTCNVFSHR